jgi:hypothetical protein
MRDHRLPNRSCFGEQLVEQGAGHGAPPEDRRRAY